MHVARAIIATILAMGLVIIVIIQESLSRDFWIAVGVDPEVFAAIDAAGADSFRIDSTFLLLAVAIVILTVPDALGYWRRNRNSDDSRPASQEDDE